ncbi:MAG: hypothetical protein U0L77_05780, partial [Prevotellamassilia sp.]|nr:hypothetical protein [Prevotellamassilia sp.]
IKVENNKVTLSFDGDKETFEGRLEFVAGKSMSIVMFDDNAVRLTYDYCENDLSDEVIGMWVVTNGGPDMTVETFNEDGTAIFTGVVDGNMHLNVEVNYKVVGDLMFYTIGEEQTIYTPYRLKYSPNETSYGDLMTWQLNDEFSFTRLRVKQSLNLAGKTYDYSSAYVSNAKGADEDFTIAGETFNIANITGYDFDEMFGSDLFSVEFPNANTIKHKFRPNGQNVEDLTPITVDGNKVTLDMGASNPAWRTVEMYMFQDADNSQLHIFMSTQSCINYLANLEIPGLVQEGKLDPTDAAAVEKVFADMEARVESINVSFVMKVRK